MNNKLKKTLIGITAAVGAVTAPIIPQNAHWVHSIETVRFNTTDGDLHAGQYAPAFDDKGVLKGYYAVYPSTAPEFSIVSKSYDTTGQQQVTVIGGKAYYDLFLDDQTGIYYKASSDTNTYRQLGTPQHDDPKKTLVKSLVGSIQKAKAAIALDTAPSTLQNCSGCSSLTYSHTVTGSNPLIVVGALTDVSVTSVTYNGAAMTITPESPVQAGSESLRSRLYYKFAPSTGANNVVISLGGTTTVYSHSASYTGVASSATLDNHASSLTSSATTASLTIQVCTANSWIVGMWRNDAAGGPTAGANTTMRATDSAGPLGDTNGAQSTGNQSITATISPAQNISWIGFHSHQPVHQPAVVDQHLYDVR